MSTEPLAVHMVTAGYVVVSPTRRPEGYGPGVPDPFVTISWCLADRLRVPEFSGWFQDLDGARDAWSADPEGALLMVVTMTPQDAAELIRELPEEPEHFELLHTRSAEPENVRWLGFEIVGAETCLAFHSWHCHGYAAEAAARLGTRLTDQGLLATYEEAAEVRTWMLGLPSDQRPISVPWAVIRLGIVST